MTNARDVAGLPDPDADPVDPDTGRGAESRSAPANRPLPITTEEPDVGLAQKGDGEHAVIRRETEI